jgi:SsrA-binding protein
MKTMSDNIKIIARNRRARHDYHIEKEVEAGIVLQGTEVKSLRAGKANLQEAFCSVVNGEMMLLNCHISPYSHGNQFNHDPVRPRKLLLHRREIEQFAKASQQKGYTIIPLKLYFRNGYAKVEVGLAKGKKLYDKRTDIAERETQRRLDRVMRDARSSE